MFRDENNGDVLSYQDVILADYCKLIWLQNKYMLLH